MKLNIFLTLSLALALSLASCAPEPQGNEESEEWSDIDISTQYEQARLVKVASFENPWAVAFLPDDRKLVTEKAGRLFLLNNGDKQEISGLPEIHAQSQGGLMDVSIHPDFGNNQWVYLTYSKPNGNGETATTLIRGQLDGNSLTNVEEIFIQNRYSGPGRHYGSRLAWANDGTLFMSIGDRGSDPPRAQDTQDHAGTVVRINDDGSVPSDNPFVNDDNVLDEIYSYGHRNIQGMIIIPDNGEIWATEHGPRGGDELNLVEAGNNYGWPIVTLGRDYRSEGEFGHSEARTREGMVDPVYEMLPTHAPSGLAYVNGSQFPAWEGNLLAGGLRSERIRRLVIENHEVIHDEELLLGAVGRIRDVRQGPDGNIYVLSDETDGGLFRLEPAN